MSTQHTPGPWAAINWTYHSTSTVVIDDASVVTGKRVIAECATEADARLISASPELLEALRALLPRAESLNDEGPDGEGWQSDKLEAEIAQARAAIAKATEGKP